jgi:hypothetical protein
MRTVNLRAWVRGSCPWCSRRLRSRPGPGLDGLALWLGLLVGPAPRRRRFVAISDTLEGGLRCCAP